MAFSNGSGASLDGISPQVLKKLTAELNGPTALNFLRALTNLVNAMLEGKVFRISTVLLWCEINCAKKLDGRLRLIIVGKTFRRLTSKYAGYHVFESRQARYGSRQVGVGTESCAELALIVFPCLIESAQPKENAILKIDFETAFNSIN